MKKYIRILTISFVLALSSSSVSTVAAQCPMCRMSAESNLQNGGTAGKGLNNGILYMLATPYVLIGLIGYVWWRNRKREHQDMFEHEN